MGIEILNCVKESGEKHVFPMGPELAIFGLRVRFCTDSAIGAAVYALLFLVNLEECRCILCFGVVASAATTRGEGELLYPRASAPY